MYIANPIYDVVFKFMMEDEKVAKSFLSAIIGEEVVELSFAAQERTMRIPKEINNRFEDSSFYTVCRFDFSAQISMPDGGFKTVLIELQKAKLASDIMRFRRYLGLHYQNESNTYVSEEEQKARQIYCIFLLGRDINIPERPVIEVDYRSRDVTTKEDLNVTNEFIQSLHHRSWIVQIDQLKQRRRNDLEKLLSIFDQENRTLNHHILNVKETDFPEIYRPIIRRLRMACESEDIQMDMEMEDDYIKDMQSKERLLAKERKINEEQRKINEEQQKINEKQRKIIEEKDKTIEEKDKAIEELRRQLAETQKQK
ncbi:MAG: hypothetical protein LBS55_09180 [Prevotellaceae bacterium]|jgi:hypothetical protein|nr:hypothetical protein [Prevotellaceae bacterium]